MAVRSAPTPPVGHQVVELVPGKHASPAQGVCVVELASMLAGEPFGDHPKCVCPVVASYMRTLNDGLDDARRRELIPYAAAIVGTRGPRALRARRARLCLGWAEQLGMPSSRIARLSAGWAAAQQLGRLCARAALRGAGPEVALTLADALIAESVEVEAPGVRELTASGSAEPERVTAG